MTAQGDEAVRECVARLARGGVVLVADDRDREDEGDLVCAAERMTEEMMAFFLRNGSGIVCTPMSDERADALGLPPMVADNTDAHRTAFTVTTARSPSGSALCSRSTSRGSDRWARPGCCGRSASTGPRSGLSAIGWGWTRVT